MPRFINKMSRRTKTITVAVLSAVLILSVSLGVFFGWDSDGIKVSNKTESSLSEIKNTEETEASDIKDKKETQTQTKAENPSDDPKSVTTTVSSTAVSGGTSEQIYENDVRQSATSAEGNSSEEVNNNSQFIAPNENSSDKHELYENYNLNQHMLSNLNDDEKDVLFTILRAVQNHETQVEIKNNVIKYRDKKTLDDLFLLVKIALAKTDMLLPTYGYSGGEYITSITLNYRLTENEAAAQKAQLKSKVNRIMTSVTDDMDDYEKLLLFHDEIVSFCSYSLDNENSRSAYGCLVEGKASCEGYSKALLELCDAAGIDCVVVTGTAFSNSRQVKHMWNKVRVSGRWYNIDLCWDDADVSSRYDYFLVTDKEILTNHTIELNRFYDLPSAVFETDNYFVKNGAYVKNEDEIISAVTRAVEQAVRKNSNTVSVKFKNKKLFENADNLFSDSYISNPIFEIIKSVSKEQGVGIDTSSVYKFVNEDILTMSFEISYEDEPLAE